MKIEKKESLLSEMQMKKRSAVADTYIAARKELGLWIYLRKREPEFLKF
jgi:hypothetical protein